MRRCQALSRLALALTVVIAGCGDDGPTPPPDPLAEQVEALWPAGTARDQAQTLLTELQAAAVANNDALAEAKAMALADLTLDDYRAERLQGSAAALPGALDTFLTDVFKVAGLPEPPLSATSFGPDGIVAVVEATGGTFTTPGKLAGIVIPAAALASPVLLVVDRLPDSSQYAVHAGPLPTTLDQYPLFYHYSTTPAVTFTADAIIGICQVTDPASRLYIPDAIFPRIQLAHPNPATPSTIELLERVDAPFVNCTDVSATFVRGQPGAGAAALALARRPGIGGRVRKFSPFGAVDPLSTTLTIGTSTLPQGIAGTPYTATLEVTGGAAPYVWAVSAGTLPTGLTLAAATGVISGTPPTPGTATFTVRVTSGALTADAPLSIVVGAIAAVDDDVIIFSKSVAGAEDACMAKVDGTAQRCLGIAVILDGELEAPRFSVDRRRIVFYAKPADPNDLDLDQDYDVFVANADGSGLLDLTNTVEDNEGSPAFSPNGSQVVYETDNFSLAVRNADGTGTEQLLTTGSRDRSPDWSPDGTRIAFVREDRATFQSSVWVVNSNGANPHAVPSTQNANGDGARWSPDGTKLLFSSLDPVSGVATLILIAPDGSGRQVISTGLSYGNPSWSPNGSKIGFSSGAAVGDAYTVINADGSGAVTVPFVELSDPSWR